MNKTTFSICFALAFALTGCTVHHYHHHTNSHGAKGQFHKGKKGQFHKGKKGWMKRGLPAGHPKVGGMCAHDLPEGHPKVKGMCGHSKSKKGHGMKGHGMKGHGMKGHGTKGHGMKGHGTKGHGMKGHGALPAGHPPVDSDSGHHGSASESSSPDIVANPFERHGGAHGKAGQDHAEHHGKHPLPAAIEAFHTSFASAWHAETDADRRTAACANVAEWKKQGVAVKKLKGGVVFAAATKDLHKQIQGVSSACLRKKGDVQSAMVATHDALHMIFRVLPQSASASAPAASVKSPSF